MKGVVTSGDSIGHYRMLQTLGEGGMGVVYLAVDPEGRKVAIKVLRSSVAGDTTARRRLAREVDTMRRVHSPHVAEILDADVTAERPYIVTQYVPGRTLEEIVEESGPISGPGLQRLAVGLSSALSAIHGAGIIHRDLKPGNVMLVDGEPVVIDFGIAQGADATRLTATGMVIGTPGYLAPEIIEGEDAGEPSDVHSWAGTVAYAATGRPPFGAGTFESIFFKIMQGKPDLSGVPDGLLPVLRSAMARHPAERPTAVNLVQLTRRIHFESTITDQTRIDDHYTRPDDQTLPDDFTLPGDGTPPGGGHTGHTRPPGQPAADHSRQFSAPMPAQPPPQAEPQPPGPAPVPAQPKDFKGLLPPAAPPPVPPPAPGPYGQGDPYSRYGQQQPPQTQPHPGGLQRGPEQGGPYDPYAEQRPGGQSPEQQGARPRGRDEPPGGKERPKPYGWYRVLSLIVLVALLGFANIAPLLALAVTGVGVLVLRMGDKAAKGMEDRRTRRGPRAGDAVAAAFKSPLHLPGAVMATVLLGALSVLAGLILLAVLMIANPDQTASRAISYSVMAMIGLLCLAPGSGAPRRQLARLWGAMLPRTEAALAAALILGIFAAVLVVLSQKQPPDTTPLNGMSQNLESLRSDVRDLVSGFPFL
ncbi:MULTISPECIES: serine/threonine-protein kinase [Thermomonosporaceae]|uniref:serine/threonine-protein kinase n=1 Tax=Thermomonosporaceae TaxID=2012 RepID=UPI00255AF6BB|nr:MULTISPECIES: serine/threonine-protein kinase [Thermomonosporaceae]MDL4771772.1 serine/threonine-protein kinase [Actinomadura xylanilytica]